MLNRILFGMLIGILGYTMPVRAQDPPSVFGEEPMADVLGAPMYPGSEFIRLIDTIDPQYVTAMYISLVPFELVEDFFERKLTEKRIVTYDDDEVYLTAFLLKTWSQFPFDPTREEIEELQHEPTVQIQYYDPNAYKALAEYFDEREDGEQKSMYIRRGETMILYTYERPSGPSGVDRLVGTWHESSRDLDEYWKSELTFMADGTYTFTMTPDNIAALATDSAVKTQFDGSSEQEIVRMMNTRNPETGTYTTYGNNISLKSDQPVDGMGDKIGLFDIGTVSMSIELANKPRLTFIRSN